MSAITKTCRICVLEKVNLVHIKQTFESCGQKSTLGDIYNDCSPVQIYPKDGFPEHFCIGCLSELLKTYEFRQKCLKSVKLLENKFIQSASDDENSVPETIVIKKRKLSEADEDAEPTPSCSKMQKKGNSVDFENVIVKNEIIFQNSNDGYNDSEEEEEEEEEPVPSTSKNEEDKVVNGEKVVTVNTKQFKKVMMDGKEKLILMTGTPKTKNLAFPVKTADHPDLGEFKITVMRGYKNSSHVVFEANGFLYVNTRNTPHRRYLRCSTSRNCPGKACIDVKPHDVMEEYLYVYRLHNHPKDTLHITKLNFLEEMRTVAASGNFPPKQVYEIAIKKFPELRNIMPYSGLSSRLYRLATGYNLEQNQQIDTLVKFAKYLTKEKPRKYCQTNKGQQFFQEALIDPEKESCSVIYANTQLIENVSWNNELFVDSSFKINFENGQSYHFLTICIAVNEHRFPAFFALMDTPSQEEYTKILTLFKDKYAPSLHPQEIVTDFNANLFKALTEVYNHSTISGSLIHFIFYIYKQCNVDDIVKQIELRAECMKLQSCLFSLPVLPAELISSALDHLKREALNLDVSEIFESIFDYIDETWIGGVTPQVFTSYCSISGINENIFNTFKKIRDIISSNKKFGFFDLNEKLLALEDWVSSTYLKVLYGEKLPRQFAPSKFEKVLNKLWQPKQIEKMGFHYFFETVSPLIEKMTGLIWIWGFYNYNGSNDDPLICPEDYFGADISRQYIITEEDETDDDIEVDEEEDGTQVITLQLVKPGVVIQEEN